MAWRVFCKHCKIPFGIERSTIGDQNAVSSRELALTCPVCGIADHYTAQDVVDASVRAASS